MLDTFVKEKFYVGIDEKTQALFLAQVQRVSQKIVVDIQRSEGMLGTYS